MQSRVIKVGFRRYEVLKATANNADFQEMVFENLEVADLLHISNGNQPIELKVGAKTAHSISIPANTYREIPMKAQHVWVKCLTAGQTSAVEVIGFSE